MSEASFWNCKRCTFENPMRRRFCEICENRRSIDDTLDSSVSSSAGRSKRSSKRNNNKKKRTRNHDSPNNASPGATTRTAIDIGTGIGRGTSNATPSTCTIERATSNVCPTSIESAADTSYSPTGIIIENRPNEHNLSPPLLKTPNSISQNVAHQPSSSNHIYRALDNMAMISSGTPSLAPVETAANPNGTEKSFVNKSATTTSPSNQKTALPVTTCPGVACSTKQKKEKEITESQQQSDERLRCKGGKISAATKENCNDSMMISSSSIFECHNNISGHYLDTAVRTQQTSVQKESNDPLFATVSVPTEKFENHGSDNSESPATNDIIATDPEIMVMPGAGDVTCGRNEENDGSPPSDDQDRNAEDDVSLMAGGDKPDDVDQKIEYEDNLVPTMMQKSPKDSIAKNDDNDDDYDSVVGREIDDVTMKTAEPIDTKSNRIDATAGSQGKLSSSSPSPPVGPGVAIGNTITNCCNDNTNSSSSTDKINDDGHRCSDSAQKNPSADVVSSREQQKVKNQEAGVVLTSSEIESTPRGVVSRFGDPPFSDDSNDEDDTPYKLDEERTGGYVDDTVPSSPLEPDCIIHNKLEDVSAEENDDGRKSIVAETYSDKGGIEMIGQGLVDSSFFLQTNRSSTTKKTKEVKHYAQVETSTNSFVTRSEMGDLAAATNCTTNSTSIRGPMIANVSSPLQPEETKHDSLHTMKEGNKKTKECSAASLSPPPIAQNQTSPLFVFHNQEDRFETKSINDIDDGNDNTDNDIGVVKSSPHTENTIEHSNEPVRFKEPSLAASANVGPLSLSSPAPSSLPQNSQSDTISSMAIISSPSTDLTFRYTPPSQEDDEEFIPPPNKRKRLLPSHNPSLLRKNLAMTSYNGTGKNTVISGTAAATTNTTGRKRQIVSRTAEITKFARRPAIDGSKLHNGHLSSRPQNAGSTITTDLTPKVRNARFQNPYRSITRPMKPLVTNQNNRTSPTAMFQAPRSSHRVQSNSTPSAQSQKRVAEHKHVQKHMMNHREPADEAITTAYSISAKSGNANPLFRTAGSQQPIHVSAESLHRANHLLHSSQAPLTMFRTAGSKQSIHVSAKNKERANSLLKPADETAPTKALFRTAGSSKSIHVSSENMHRASSILKSADETAPARAMFRTAGLKQSIHVSSENMERPSNILESTGETAPTRALFRTAGSSKSIHVSSEQMERASNVLESASAPASTSATFRTAGSTKSIQASSENMQRAHNVAKSASASPPKSTGFRTAGSNKSIHVSQESMQRANHVLNSANAPPPLTAGFRTAGSSKSIHVSQEGIQRANRVLNSVNTPPPLTAGFRTAGSSKSIHVSQEGIQRANRVLNSANAPPPSPPPSLKAGFCTAGSNKSIHVSQEDMQRGNHVLNSANTPPQPTPPSFTAGFRTAGSSKSIHVSQEDIQWANHVLNSANTPPPLTAGFRTAGSSKSIHVSQEGMQRANHVLNSVNAPPPSPPPSLKAGFCTAGSNKSIHLSQEDMQRGNHVLNSANTPPQPTPPSFTAGFRTAGPNKSIHVSQENIERARIVLESANESRAAISHAAGINQSLINESNVSSQPASNVHQHTIAPSFAKFRKAGSNHSILVSTERMQRADHLLHGELAKGHSHNGVTKCLVEEKKKETIDRSGGAIFRTAGSEQTIQISEESIQRANVLLQGHGEEMSEQHVDAMAPRLIKDKAKGKIMGPPTAFFRTAGSEKSIHVSTENMQVANRLLHVSNKDETLDKGVDNKPLGIETKRRLVSKNRRVHRIIPATATSKASQDQKKEIVGQSLAAMFRTAGSNQSIKVSAENIQHANRIFAPENMPPDAMVRTLGSNPSTQVSTDSVQQPTRLLKSVNVAPAATRTVANPRMPPPAQLHTLDTATPSQPGYDTKRQRSQAMFHTAGSRQTIQVSSRSLQRASFLFEEGSKEGSKYSHGQRANHRSLPKDPPGSRIVPAEICKDLHATKVISTGLPSKSLKQANIPLESNNATPAAMFHTAGSNRSIHVSSENVQRANRLFETNLSPQKSAVFCTTGSNPSIHVSSEQKQLMDRLLHQTNNDTIDESTKSLVQKHEESSVHSVPATPLPNVSAPHVRWGSIHKAMYGLTPKPTPKSESSDSYNYPTTPVSGSPFQVAARGEVLSGVDGTPQVTIIRNAAAKVTLSGKHRPAQRLGRISVKRQKNVSPVPINFVREDRRDPPSNQLDSNSPLQHSCRSERTEEADCNGKLDNAVKSGDAYSNHLDSRSPLQDSCDLEQIAEVKFNRTLEDAVKNGDFTSDPSICLRCGVKRATLLVDSLNAASLRLSSTTGLPVGFLGDAGMQFEKVIGSANDYRNLLVEQGCNSDLLSEKWLSNHLRWTIWKFAAYERRFAPYVGGKYLNLERIVLSLKARYERELFKGHRPALRMVLNGDVAAGRTMILVVAHIFPDASADPPSTKNVQRMKIELSDGWYSSPALLDVALSGFVRSGLVKVGSKLVVSSSRLVGADEGIDPLDDGFCPSDPSCSVSLLISANATRLAKWDSKLGFVRNSPYLTPKGLVLTKRISDIIPQGGNIPVIRVVVMRRYPLLYLEKGGSGGEKFDSTNSRSVVLTEMEEERRKMEHEKKFSKAVEKLSEQLEADIAKEVDEGAPEAWKRMLRSASPEECFEELDEGGKSRISQWKQTRSELISRRVQLEVQAEMEVETALVRTSRPFIRMKVRSVCSSKSYEKENALLSIWNPNEDQLDLEEGAAIQFENLAVSSSKQDGLIQLTATGRTSFERWVSNDTTLHEQIGFTERRFLNVFQLYCTSRKAALKENTGEHLRRVEFDIVVFVVKILKTDVGVTIYASDESKLVIRILCKSLPFGIGCPPESAVWSNQSVQVDAARQVYGFLDLKLLRYDHEEDCVVAQFSDAACVVRSGQRVDQLRRTVAEESSNFLNVVRRLDIGLPLMERPTAFYAVGYIVGLKAADKGKLNIEVDCGCQRHEWGLPVSCIESMVPVAAEYQQAVLMPEEEDRIKSLGVLGPIYRARGLLWKFHLRSNSIATAPNSCQYVVEKVEKADLLKLAYLFGS